MELETNLIHLPAIAMRGIVVFPNNTLSFDVGREKSKKSVALSIEKGRLIFLIGQKDYINADPAKSDMYKIGTVAEIKQTVNVRGGNIRVVAEGLYRARMVDLFSFSDHLEADILPYPEKVVRLKDENEAGAIIRSVRVLFSEYSKILGGLPKDVTLRIMTSEDIRFLSEYIPSNLMLKYEDKQKILEESNCLLRLQYIAEILDNEINVLTLENEILNKVRTSVDKNQRDYMLREQMRVIAEELGEMDNPLEESAEYEDKIHALPIDKDSKDKLLSEAKKLSKMPPASHDGAVIRSYLDYVLSLPFGVKSEEKNDILYAEKVLERDHYGLSKVKERILETIAVRNLSGGKNANIICLSGPPGVGKTSIAKSIASALGRKYVRFALGGVHDEAEIRGHRKTYIGAMPGKIIDAIKTAGTTNPLILLDEIDKLSKDYKGDPGSALLEVLDKEQNFSFRDNYLEIPFDLSDVLFITTANDSSAIPSALYDRMEIIDLEGYTREEKFQIAKRHLIKKQLSENGLKYTQFRINDKALYSLIDLYTREAGVRSLERKIATLMRKAAKKLCENEEKVLISDKNLSDYLGAPIYLSDEIFDKNETGIATGLAWTAAGGEVLPIEVLILKGSGKTEFTGKLGDVFKESCLSAISYIRSISDKLLIDSEFYKNCDIHIHAPEAATPKDGPSAGITITTAILSALTGIPVRNDIAMTGEITLKGTVLPIGGLKAKAMAAHRLGIKTILIPYKNIKDLEEVDEKVKKEVEFIPCSHFNEVINLAFTSSLPIKDEKETKSLNIPSSQKNDEAFITQ